MKRFICLLVSLLLLCPVALAADPDFASMTDDELLSMINGARNELFSRKMESSGKVMLIDREDMQIYLTGKTDTSGRYLDIEVVFVNNTDEKLSVHNHSCIVNGWEVYCDIIGETSAGSKKKDTFQIKMDDADISSLSEMEDMVISLYTYNSTTNKQEELGTVKILYDGQSFSVAE